VKPTEIIPLFDAFLADHGIGLEAILVGGAALALQGVIARETRDCDIIEPALPETVLDASKAFASELRKRGEILREDWLNNGPSQLASILPTGWREHLQIAYQGRALMLWSLGRAELLLSKLFALCDRGQDLNDCVALMPTKAELDQSEPWIVQQDTNPEWPMHVKATLQDLGRRCGHGLQA
jgi:hypothetical protein